MIKIPLAAEGLAVVSHQHAKTLAALPVKQLHAQLLVGPGPGREFLPAPEKGIRAVPHQRHWQVQPLDRHPEGALGRLHQMQFADALFRDPALQSIGKGGGFAVVHAPAALAQLGGEVAHGTPHQHQLLAVVAAVLQHRSAFDQQHPCFCRSEAGEGRLAWRELVAEHPDPLHGSLQGLRCLRFTAGSGGRTRSSARRRPALRSAPRR